MTFRHAEVVIAEFTINDEDGRSLLHSSEPFWDAQEALDWRKDLLTEVAAEEKGWTVFCVVKIYNEAEPAATVLDIMDVVRSTRVLRRPSRILIA